MSDIILNKVKKKFRDYSKYIIIILLFLLSWTCLTTVTWYDEQVTIVESVSGLSNLIEQLRKHDVYPPLYYAIITGISSWIKTNLDSVNFLAIVPIMKAVSFAFYALFICISYSFIQKIKGTNSAFIFALLCLSLPALLSYSIEIRPYMLGILALQTGWLCAIAALLSKNRLYWIGYGVSTAVAMYTHYYAMFTFALVSGCLFVYLLIFNRKHIASLIIANVCALIAFSPWIPILLEQISKVQNSWWNKQGILETLNMIPEICGLRIEIVDIIFIVLVLQIFLYALFVTLKEKNWLSCFLLIVGLLIVPLSWMLCAMNSLVNGQTIIMGRYIIFGVGIYLLGIAWACSYLPHIIRYALSVLLVILAAFSVFSHISKTYTAHASIKAWETIVNNMDKPYVYFSHLHFSHKDVFYTSNSRNIIPVIDQLPDFAKRIGGRLSGVASLIKHPSRKVGQLQAGETVLVRQRHVKRFEEELKQHKLQTTRKNKYGYWLYTIKGQES